MTRGPMRFLLLALGGFAVLVVLFAGFYAVFSRGGDLDRISYEALGNALARQDVAKIEAYDTGQQCRCRVTMKNQQEFVTEAWPIEQCRSLESRGIAIEWHAAAEK
jgi:hypothetical protein